MASYMVGPDEGASVQIGGLGVIYKLASAETGGTFALVEHPLALGELGAPPHTHTHEDEYSYVLEGEIAVLVGDELIHATPGALVKKPRGVPHAFWNAGSVPARVLEIISPAGFERYFAELAQLALAGGQADRGAINALAERYGLRYQIERMPELAEKYGAPLPAAFRSR